jgi:hypothetical protein
MNEMNHRMGFVGGSDMMTIMDGDWEHLWQIKTGRIQPTDLSNVFPVQLGIATEEFNVQMVEQHTDKTFLRQHSASMVWNNVPLKATLDGYWFDEGVECKHTYERNTLENQLQRYMPQLQFYMWVADCTHIYFANIFGNRDWKMCKVNRDEDYIRAMHDPLLKFWSFVSSDTQPQLPHYPVMQPRINHIAIDDMITRDMTGDNAFADRAHDFIETKDAHKLHESAKADLKAMLGPDERELYSDILSVKRTKSGVRITAKKEV